MAKQPKITLEMDGMEEMTAMLDRARDLLDEIRETIDSINIARLSLQVKINQPAADAEMLNKEEQVENQKEPAARGGRDLERLECGKDSINAIRLEYGLLPIDSGDTLLAKHRKYSRKRRGCWFGRH